MTNYCIPLSPQWWKKRKNRKKQKAAKDTFFGPDIPVFTDWKSASEAAGGYGTDVIFQKVLASARAVRDGQALWERDSFLFYHEEYNIPLIASLMTVAAWNRGHISLLDFGGAFGSTYMQHRDLLDKLDHIDWNIVEQQHFVETGKKEFAGGHLHFWSSMQDCVENKPIGAVLFSGVLQYMEDPYALIAEACALKPQAIIVDRTPLFDASEKLIVQHVPEAIYNASYPCWLFDRKKLKTVLQESYFCMPEHPSQVDPQGFWGFMAVRKEN